MTDSGDAGPDIRAAAQAVVAGLAAPGADGSPVTDALDRLGIPALSVALVRGGRLASARAWGRRRPGSPERATTDTRFLVGSVSKPVAATAALRLVADGVLDLDEDVTTRLTGWAVEPLGGWQPTVSLRHLLSHTAGTTMHGFPGYPHDHGIPSTAAVLAGKGNTPPVVVDSLPGVRWRYSGGGTTVVQLLIEEVTGRSFPEVLDDLVLRPAGMTTATFEQPPPEQLHPLLAEGTTADGAPVPGGWRLPGDGGGRAVVHADRPRALGRGGAAGARRGCRRAAAGRARDADAARAGAGLGPRAEGQSRRPAPALRTRRVGRGLPDAGGSRAGRRHRPRRDGQQQRCGAADERRPHAVVEAEEWPDFPAPPADAAALLARYTGEWLLPDGRSLQVDATPDGLVLHLPEQHPLPLSPRSASLWATPIGAEVEFALTGPDDLPTSLTTRPAAAFTARRPAYPFRRVTRRTVLRAGAVVPTASLA